MTVSDSNGYIYDPNGIQLDVVKDIKLGHRGRIKEYAERVPGSEYHEGCKGVWTVKCDIALPCATQERDRRGIRQGAGGQRLHRGLRGREHALHPGGH